MLDQAATLLASKFSKPLKVTYLWSKKARFQILKIWPLGPNFEIGQSKKFNPMGPIFQSFKSNIFVT